MSIKQNTKRAAAAVGFALVFLAAAFASGGTEQPQTGEEGQPVQVELMIPGWVNQPVPDDAMDNPYKAYVLEHFDIDLTLTNTSEFNDQILVRFASSSPPDIVRPDNVAILRQLYAQGVLVDDWNQYLEAMPTVDSRMLPEARLWLTEDDKLIAITDAPEPSIWGWKIRQDWLDNLGIEMPTTTEELLDVGRAFTFDDTDGNGLDDTYGFTTAAGGQGIGDLFILQDMFGPDNFYVAGDGTVQHPVTDGNKLLFLEFLRTIIEEGLIDPDWATQSWQVKNTKLYNAEHPSLGICYFPGVLVMESENVYESSGETIDWFSAMPTPTGSPIGGKTRPGGLYASPKSVSAVAEADTAKMDAIVAFLDGTNYPNDGYWALRWGQGIDEAFVLNPITEVPDYYYCYWSEESFVTDYPGAWDYGKIVANRGDNVVQGSVTATSPGRAVLKNIELDSAEISFPRYDPAPLLLSLDPGILQSCKDVEDEFVMKYILGQTTDYEGFVSDWLRAGGESLLAEATAQYRELGYMR